MKPETKTLAVKALKKFQSEFNISSADGVAIRKAIGDLESTPAYICTMCKDSGSIFVNGKEEICGCQFKLEGQK